MSANSKESKNSNINFKRVIITALSGGTILLFETKKSYAVLPVLLYAGLATGASLINAVAKITQSAFEKSLKDLTGWGLYQAQVLINSIGQHGLLYYLAFIIFIYGLFSAFVSIGENKDIPLWGIISFLFYFFIMFSLINTKVTNPYNPLNLSVRLSNGIVNEILRLYGGVKAADMDNYKVVEQQVNRIMVKHDVSTGGYINQALSDKIADFVKQCEPTKNAMGPIVVAISDFDSVLENINYYDKNTGKLISCAQVRQQLENKLDKQVNGYINQVAKERGVSVDSVKKATIEEAKMFFNTQVKEALKNAIPSAYGSTSPYDMFAPSSSLSSGVELTDDDYLALSAFSSNDLSTQVYNALYNQSVGLTSNGSGGSSGGILGSIKSFLHLITGGLKQLLGGLFISLLDIVNSILVPYVAYGFYMTNTIFFAFLEAFFPLVWILNMGRVVNLKSLIKYVFVMIWVKSWVIPAVFLTQIYNFYMNDRFPSMAALIYIFLMFAIPSMMAMILLEGNAILSKMEFGVSGATRHISPSFAKGAASITASTAQNAFNKMADGVSSASMGSGSSGFSGGGFMGGTGNSGGPSGGGSSGGGGAGGKLSGGGKSAISAPAPTPELPPPPPPVLPA